MIAILRPLVTVLAAAAAWALEPGDQAPSIVLPAADGPSWSLADQAGKWVVLEWVNFDCPFVRKQYDSGNMQALQKRWRDQGVVWASICSSAPGKQGHLAGAALTERIAAERSAAAVYLVDETGAVGRAYDARTTPHMVIINPAGAVVYWGAIDSIVSTDPADAAKADNYVSATLETALAGGSVTTAATKPYGCSVKY